jgi:hypothetical protein
MSFLVNPYWYGGCDPDAVAFLTAAGITDPTITSAICTLVTSMKANGTWAKMNAIYPFVGNTASQQKWNLKDPRDLNAAYRLSFVGGWTHSSNGALPNGVNAYADTFLNPSLNYTTSMGLSYYSRTNANTGTDQIDLGVTDLTNFLWISTQYNASGFVNRFLSRNSSSSILANAANADARGFYLSSKTSNAANAFKIFKNGVLQNTQTGAGNPPNANLFLGAYNNTILPGILFSNRQCAFATISTGLSDAEAGTLYTDVQAFNTTLGRQVP